MESTVCMPDGTCALSSDVAYVDGSIGIDNSPCTKDLPCTRIDKAATAKQIVKIAGTVTNRCSLTTGSVKILAEPGAKLEPSDNGIAFEIKGDSKIEVYDLQISNAKQNGSSGVVLADTADLSLTRVTVRDNPGNGISTTSTGQLTCTRCLLASNGLRGIDASMGTIVITQSTIAENTSGGIQVRGPGAFHIVNNFVFHNGQSAGKAAASGISIQVDAQQAGAAANELDFNSISHNTAQEVEQGVQCNSGTPLIASNNIIWGNGSTTKLVQVNNGSGCNYRFSDIGQIPVVDVSDINVNPAFQDEGAGNLHLTKDSMVRGKADPGLVPSGMAAQDIDGEARSAPADMGADQFHMP
jgi:hypothetical protein